MPAYLMEIIGMRFAWKVVWQCVKVEQGGNGCIGIVAQSLYLGSDFGIARYAPLCPGLVLTIIGVKYKPNPL